MNEFNELVLKDLKEGVSEEEEARLLDNPEEWREALILLVRKVESEISKRSPRFDYMANSAQRRENEKWRESAREFKEDILARMREVKLILRDKNIEENEVSGTNKTLMLILAEMQAVRKLLEERTAP